MPSEKTQKFMCERVMNKIESGSVLSSRIFSPPCYHFPGLFASMFVYLNASVRPIDKTSRVSVLIVRTFN